MDTVITELADTYPTYLILATHSIAPEARRSNVLFTPDIITTDADNNLCENSYFSTKCDIIIGRESGPSMFAWVKDNTETSKKQLFIAISFSQPFLSLGPYLCESKRCVRLTKFEPVVQVVKNYAAFFQKK